jgi:hypothetical protein
MTTATLLLCLSAVGQFDTGDTQTSQNTDIGPRLVLLTEEPLPAPPALDEVAALPEPPVPPREIDINQQYSAPVGDAPYRPSIEPFGKTYDPLAPDSSTTAGGAFQAGRSQASDADTSLQPKWMAVFREAAHFPVIGFGKYGDEHTRDVVIIYESMSFTATETGQYEVRFMVEVPRTQVVMRLQLHFHRYVLDPQPAGQTPRITAHRVGTITLAPITLQAGESQTEESQTFAVSRRGYSEVLREIAGNVLDTNGNVRRDEADRYTISRSGTARVGSAPVRQQTY